MQGGAVVFLFVLIIVGLGVGGFLLFGAGGYARHKQVEGELGHDDDEFRRERGMADGGRPEHLRVSDDANATTNIPPPPPTRAAPPD